MSTMSMAQVKEIVGPNSIRYVDNNRMLNYGYDTLQIRLKNLTDAFDHINSQWLSLNEILPHIQSLLIDPVFMKYTLENIDPKTQFQSVYNEIFVNNGEYFTQIKDPFKQFALGWLYTRYH